MPDIKGKTQVRSIAADAWWRIYWWGFWSTELAGALLVGLTAAALAAARIELQYVVGGVLVVFARKIATKRIFSQSKADSSQETQRPTRELFARYGDKRAAAMDVDIAP